MVRATLAILCLLPTAAAAQESLAVVRTVAVHAAPPGWLGTEERVFAALGERFESLVPASVAADLWQAPGFRWDRARERIRAALNGAEEALGKNDVRAARRHLKDVGELLELGPVVAVLSGSTLRRYHRLEARAATARGRSAEVAVARYLSLTGAEPTEELDPVLVGRVQKESKQPAGLTVNVKPGRAVVFLDGVRIGEGDVRRYDIAPGRHYLQVAAVGHETFGERIELAAGSMTRRNARLKSFDDPLTDRGRSLSRTRPVEKEVERVRELATNLGVGGVMVLVSEETGMTLRYYEVGLGAWRPAVKVSYAASGDELARRVDQALGREPAAVALEAIAAVPANGTGPTDPDPVAEPIVATDGGFSTRWLWVGAGVVAVVGVVVAVVVASGSDSDPGRAQVWLCPGGSTCVP